MKQIISTSNHKKLNRERCDEWKNVVSSSLWKLWFVAFLLAVFLFIFFKPTPNCSRTEYFMLFVFRPTVAQAALLLLVHFLFDRVSNQCTRRVMSICTISVVSIFVSILVFVHTSVSYMSILLLFPMILTPLYRETEMAVFQGICSILIYILNQVYFIPHSKFMPAENGLIDMTIFIGATVAIFILVQQVNVMFILHDEKSSRDSLTHLYNHEAFYEELEHYMDNYKKTSMSFSILIADIDDFKKVNDTYGHAFGDIVICQVVAAFESNCGKNGFCARYGGEEFAMILPGQDMQEAIRVAEKVREGFGKHQFITTKGPKRFTLSVGVSEYRHSYENASTFFDQADQALYLAKNSGKNKVCCKTDETNE